MPCKNVREFLKILSGKPWKVRGKLTCQVWTTMHVLCLCYFQHFNPCTYESVDILDCFIFLLDGLYITLIFIVEGIFRVFCVVCALFLYLAYSRCTWVNKLFYLLFIVAWTKYITDDNTIPQSRELWLVVFVLMLLNLLRVGIDAWYSLLEESVE